MVRSLKGPNVVGADVHVCPARRADVDVRPHIQLQPLITLSPRRSPLRSSAIDNPRPAGNGAVMAVSKAEPGKTRIGWIGTGVMGRSMCGHLVSKGYAATVYNRTKE